MTRTQLNATCPFDHSASKTDEEAARWCQMFHSPGAQTMQHRADLNEKLNAAGARPQMTRQMTTAQLEDFLAWSEGTGGPWSNQ